MSRQETDRPTTWDVLRCLAEAAAGVLLLAACYGWSWWPLWLLVVAGWTGVILGLLRFAIGVALLSQRR